MDHRLIEAHINRVNGPVEWGLNDCAMFAGNLLRDQTGVDLVASWRDTYSSQDEAVERLTERGGGLVRQVIAAVREAGWQRVDPRSATCPALGLVTVQVKDVSDLVHVCCALSAPGWFVLRGELGVTMMPAHLVRRAWEWQR